MKEDRYAKLSADNFEWVVIIQFDDEFKEIQKFEMHRPSALMREKPEWSFSYYKIFYIIF